LVEVASCSTHDLKLRTLVPIAEGAAFVGVLYLLSQIAVGDARFLPPLATVLDAMVGGELLSSQALPCQI
jgi:hypothetical protein